MRKNYVGKPFTRSAKEQEEDAKRIILDDLKDAIEDLKIEYPNQRGYLESVLREGELIASKIVRAERKTVNGIIDNRERGLNRLNDDMLKLNINGYSFNNEDKFKEEIIRHIAFNDTRSDFIKYPMREIAIKYFYMPVLKDEARRRGIKPDSRVGQARKSKRSPRLRGRSGILVSFHRTNRGLKFEGEKPFSQIMSENSEYLYTDEDNINITRDESGKIVSEDDPNGETGELEYEYSDYYYTNRIYEYGDLSTDEIDAIKKTRYISDELRDIIN